MPRRLRPAFTVIELLVSSYQTKILGTGQMKGEVKVNRIPKRYNSNTELTKQVTVAGPNDFTFDIKSK